MTDMVERVARAMAAADSGPEGQPLFFIHWEEFGSGYLANARAAIAAMRDPTDAMTRAGKGSNYGLVANPAWRAMIDEALRE